MLSNCHTKIRLFLLTIMSKMIIKLKFEFENGHLRFYSQCNMSIALFGHTTMSGMAENHIVDNKIMNLLLICGKDIYCLKKCLKNGGHLKKNTKGYC